MVTQFFTLTKVLVLLLASLLLAGSLGMSHGKMTMDNEGGMTDCPFMPGVSICSMSPIEMASASHNFLSNITISQDLFLLLISTVLFFSILPKLFSPPTHRLRFKIYKKKYQPQFSFLIEAFSNGILNPKLF